MKFVAISQNYFENVLNLETKFGNKNRLHFFKCPIAISDFKVFEKF